MGSWKELESRIKKGQTIVKVELALINTERRRWREVLTRFVAIIHSLPERNVPLRGSTDTLYQPNNRNFLKEVELMAQFDPVLKEHIAKVQGGASHTSYLGNITQNELIDCISERVLECMVTEIRQSKYFSIILDCTPDLSHKEQLSVIIRIVAAEGTAQIKEYFMGFLEAEQTTREGLSTLILKKLKELNIPFEDCRGQSYDNGVRASTADPAIKIEAQALAEEVGSYRFSICTVVWYDILGKVQTVNKLLQSQCMHLDVAVDILKKAETSLVSYRDTGFADAQTSAKEVCEEMNVEAALKQKRLRTTKRQFSYEASDEPITDALKKMEFSFFNVVVDVAIESLRERTGMMSDVAKKFSVLINFPDLPASELEKQAKGLCNTLTSGDLADLNYDELIVEMQSFPKQWPKQNMTTLDLLVFLEEKGLKEIYLKNCCHYT
ncbi:uncharacterized protein LOC143019040 [Oratosquilla oratoria]|uniref:uncharacterized protein LOC143019040 n=1 Tax=Oratosquilla oratoria TaxID=337810 RepID=UPI003F762093